MRLSFPLSASTSRRRKTPRVSLANRGKFAEDLLETVHDIYRLSHQADIIKVPTPIGRGKPIGDGHFEAWYVKASVSDYLGSVAPTGRALALELKSVMEPAFSLTALEIHQQAFLNRWDRMGALAYALVLFRSDRLHPDALVLKWPAFLREIETAGIRTQRFSLERLTVEFTASIRVLDGPGPRPDYLSAIRLLEARYTA
jgi:penicillin-binding protein-related factor A (putative recombinase)